MTDAKRIEFGRGIGTKGLVLDMCVGLAHGESGKDRKDRNAIQCERNLAALRNGLDVINSMGIMEPTFCLCSFARDRKTTHLHLVTQ